MTIITESILIVKLQALSRQTFFDQDIFFYTSKLHFVLRDLRRLHSRSHSNQTQFDDYTSYTRQMHNVTDLHMHEVTERTAHARRTLQYTHCGPQENKHERGKQLHGHKTSDPLWNIRTLQFKFYCNHCHNDNDKIKDFFYLQFY